MTIGGKKISLTTQIFVAMIIGSIAGLICGDIMKQVAFIGTIWLNCVKMIVVPMVFFTIITGITSQKNLSSLGRIAGHIIAYYVLTTLVATVIGLAVTEIIRPGEIANFTGLASKKLLQPLALPWQNSSLICLLLTFSLPSLKATFFKPLLLQYSSVLQS